MNIEGLVRQCAREGASLSIDGADLIVQGAEVQPVVLDLLRKHKRDVIAFLKISDACAHVPGITPAQLWQLTDDADRVAIALGEVAPETLRAYTASFADGIRKGRIAFHPSGQLRDHGILPVYRAPSA